MDVSVGDSGVFGFGPFRLDTVRRSLTQDGQVVKLPPTQFDTLLYLVLNPGRLVEKDEILAAVWGGRIIEEGNLTQTIHLLRRALQHGDGSQHYITTAPGRGYRFSAEVRRIQQPEADPETSLVPERKFSEVTEAAAEPAAFARKTRPALPALVAAGAGLLIVTGLGAAILHHAQPALSVPVSTRSEAAFHPPAHSIAVLAFTNMSGDPKQEYFSDGLTEELTNALGRIDDLQVAARTSSFTFKGGIATVGEIGRKLNVAAILEGSVRRENTHLRVTAQLINATTGFQYWSHSYDREASDMLGLEAEIAGAVAKSLKITLLEDQQTKLTAGGSRNPEAIDAYLRGISEARFYSEASSRAAMKSFEEAVRLDPDFADAHAGLAFTIILIAVTWGDDDKLQSDLASAEIEANKAIALTPDSAEAHAALGGVFGWQGNLRGADKELSLALELGPNDILVGRAYSFFEARIGRADEAQAVARHMVALDPWMSSQYYRLGWVFIYGQKYCEGLDAFERERALGTANPDRSRFGTSLGHLGLGKWNAALEDCRGNPLPYCRATEAIAYKKLGRDNEAAAAVEAVKATNFNREIMLAEIYAQWGDRALAVHWLEAIDVPGVKASSDVLLTLRVDPLLAPVRDTPQFKSLEQHLDYPPL